jgi:nucleoside-diphosphate-sugar epimerase
LRKTSLEWTQFYNGLFLDYYGMPHIETYLTPLVVIVDMAYKIAALPGSTGEEIVSFTYTRDLARFVVKALELEKWEEEMWCFSENTSFNKLLKLAEEARGPYSPFPLLIGMLTT